MVEVVVDEYAGKVVVVRIGGSWCARRSRHAEAKAGHHEQPITQAVRTELNTKLESYFIDTRFSIDTSYDATAVVTYRLRSPVLSACSRTYSAGIS